MDVQCSLVCLFSAMFRAERISWLTLMFDFQWHLGFMSKNYTPTYRGFESHFGYWLGEEDYFDHTSEADHVRSCSQQIV